MKLKALVLGLSLTLASAAAHAAERAKVLVVVSGADRIALKNGHVHPTGFFLGELVEPVFAIRARYDYDVATPAGVEPTLDVDSLRDMYWKGKEQVREEGLRYIHESEKIKHPLALESLTEEKLATYAAVFFPGGHGPMVDLASDANVARILLHFHSTGKPTALVCHGPSALLSLRGVSPWPYAGYKMTGFSDWEEFFTAKLFLGGPTPYLMNTELARLGGKVSTKKYVFTRNGSHVVRDRELITGQNPYSPEETARALIEAIELSARP